LWPQVQSIDRAKLSESEQRTLGKMYEGKPLPERFYFNKGL